MQIRLNRIRVPRADSATGKAILVPAVRVSLFDGPGSILPAFERTVRDYPADAPVEGVLDRPEISEWIAGFDLAVLSTDHPRHFNLVPLKRTRL